MKAPHDYVTDGITCEVHVAHQDNRHLTVYPNDLDFISFLGVVSAFNFRYDIVAV